MKLTKDKNGREWLTANGKRCRVFVRKGPWIGIDQDTIKLWPRGGYFPEEIRAAFAVENNSDAMTDYFEKDTIRLLPGHPLWAQAAAI